MSRPIDADALKDHLQSLAYDDWNQGVSTSWADAYRECADMVDKQPTIEERKVGHWILRAEGSMFPFMCDQCGERHNTTSNFCPNCGADMRGEKNEPEG